jgi:hypothetical protein
VTDTYADVTEEGEVRRLPVGDLFADVGATGLKRAVGVIDEEFLPALRGRKAVEVFREMSLNSSVVGSLLFTIEMLLRQVDWTVIGDDNSPEQEQAVQFVEECMDDMSQSWNDLVAEILSMLVYGWSWHEIVYKKRVGPWETDPKKQSKFTDGKIGWRKMPIRSQESFFRWIFDDDGGVQGMVQIPAPTYQQIPLSIKKGLLFRTGQHKGNPEGLSVLRRAYRPWFFLKRLEEFEAVGVERDLAGLPFAKVPSKMMGPNATPAEKDLYQAFKRMVSNVRRDEHEGLVIPSDADADTKLPKFDFQLLASGGSRTFDINATISRYEVNILSVVLADFIKLGHEQTGSYAMHVDKTGIFRAALNTLAQSMADVFNRFAIPRLFALNSWKLDRLPKITPSNVDPPNLTELSGFMTAMAGLGMTFFPDPDLEKFLRETAHLPSLSEDDEEMRRMMADQQNNMNLVQSHLEGESVKQQVQMVQGGMSPEQAMMQQQTPTPEQQQAMNPTQGLDAQGKQQDMESRQAESKFKLQDQKQTSAQRDREGRQTLRHNEEQHRQNLRHTREDHESALRQTRQAHELKLRQQRDQAKNKPFPAKKK